MPARYSTRTPSAFRGERIVRREDSMPEVAKKILGANFRRMEANEKGTRTGADIEKLHAMRVAVRRMRTAARLFGPYLDSDEFQPFVRELSALGRVLGPVRDLDVMTDHARRFRDSVPLRERIDLDALLADWQREHTRLRRRLLDHFDAFRYRRFREEFPRFLEDASAGVRSAVTKGGRLRPTVLAHVGPALLYERLSAVRAYEGWVESDDVPLRRYHRLRIEVKRFRYTLEFLEGVSGPEAEPLITSYKAVQDHLGEMREAWLTADRLERDYLSHAAPGSKASGHPGIAAYCASRRTHCEDLRASFPSVWTTVANREVHRRIAAIAASF